MASNATTTFAGWKYEPNGRGTFDILKTCAGTIFLLCWSSVCPNVPPQRPGLWMKLRGKLELFMLAILGPDFIFVVALGQFNAAWRAKKSLRQKGGWNLRQCFYANMGGVHVQFRDRDTAGLPSFPVDCEQILFLIDNNYISLPKITSEDIDDRNKADTLARSIAIIQSVWFTINAFGRVAQGLFLTTLELTTLAFIFLMTACSLCWWSKPMDVSRPLVLDLKVDLADVLQKANAPTPNLGQTPLSFLNRREWFMSKFWMHFSWPLRKIRLLPERRTKPTEADHFLSVDFMETEITWETLLGPLIPLYGCIFIAAWNFVFPTHIERYLWRAAAITNILFVFLSCIIACCSRHHFFPLGPTYCKELLSQLRGQPPRQDELKENTTATASKKSHWPPWIRRVVRFSERFVNVPPDNDPEVAVSLRLWMVTSLLVAAYSIARLYILVEDIIGLRTLPTSAYQTVDWGQYAPIL